MRTSAPGSKATLTRTAAHARMPAPRRRGFTMVELLVVLLIIAIGAGTAVFALRDGDDARLEREASRLAALFAAARAESRAAGVEVRWLPQPLGRREGAAAATPDDFGFVGLQDQVLPERHWLTPGIEARVLAGAQDMRGGVRLGPEPLLPPQRVALRLGEREALVASDGLGPFQVESVGAIR